MLHSAAGPTRTHLATGTVAQEVRAGGEAVPGWIDVVDVDTDDADDPTLLDDQLAYLTAFAAWAQLVGADLTAGHNVGEATTLAYVETFGGVAGIDDADARKVAQRTRPEGAPWCVHGSLWALSREVVEGRSSTPKALNGLCNALLDTDIRWPFGQDGYEAWYQKNRRQLVTTCCG